MGRYTIDITKDAHMLIQGLYLKLGFKTAKSKKSPNSGFSNPTLDEKVARAYLKDYFGKIKIPKIEVNSHVVGHGVNAVEIKLREIEYYLNNFKVELIEPVSTLMIVKVTEKLRDKHTLQIKVRNLKTDDEYDLVYTCDENNYWHISGISTDITSGMTSQVVSLVEQVIIRDVDAARKFFRDTLNNTVIWEIKGGDKIE